MSTVVTAPRPAPEEAAAAGPSLLAAIEGDLARVEQKLLDETRSEIGAVREISGHTLLAGGKRLRPALALLSARVVGRGEYPAERVVTAAAAAELIHMATLMHDDVVDAAPERRGRSTANSVYGNAITILTGDYLLAKSISLLAYNDDNLHIVRVFSDVTVTMAEGEVLQAAVAHDRSIPMATYEDVIERKTSRFLAGCCETGGMLGGATLEERDALRAYGNDLGTAFQIADDLLDFLGDPKKTGKSLGTDLRDGRVTLPLIHGLAVADAATRAQLEATLSQTALSDADVASVTGTLARLGGFEEAYRVAGERAERAVAALACFPASPWRETMERLARYVVSRDR
ncbi:MAG TPA: polyprenyl synthetase family protein [Armatimonadaceae bacterium]|nr:polyprenyl synthetase family protein [Armatimonadaceae bacterium]